MVRVKSGLPQAPGAPFPREGVYTENVDEFFRQELSLRFPRMLRFLLVVAASSGISGCFLVAAGAGAAGAIAYTNRGASSVVSGTVDQVFDRTMLAFGQMNITETGRATDDGGRQRRLSGTRGEYEVTAELNHSTDSTTRVEITARRSALEYDRELARDILNNIISAR